MAVAAQQPAAERDGEPTSGRSRDPYSGGGPISRSEAPTVSHDLLSDHVLRLRLRRARVFEAALALADRAARQHGRPFNTREQAQYDELTAALDRLDNQLRRLRLEARRADPSPAGIDEWCRDNNTASYSAAPGSGGRGTLAALRR